jgi:hypothetical protein
VTGRANKVPMALRLDAELAEWLAGYAELRGVKKIAVVEEALAYFRQLSGVGVPGVSAPAGRVRRAGGDPSVSRRVVEPSPAGVVDESVPAAVPASVLSRAERFRRATQGGGS